MIDHRSLTDALDLATADVDAPGLAAAALAEARRRHRRRSRAAVVAAVSVPLAAALAVLLLVRQPDGRPAPAAPPSPPSPPSAPGSPAPPGAGEDRAVIPEEVVAPEWDPRDMDGLPASPLVLPDPLVASGAVDAGRDAATVPAALAVVDWVEVGGRRGLVLVAPDGRRVRRAYPGRGGPPGVSALSPDGSRVATLSGDALWWSRVGGGPWRRIDLPDLPGAATFPSLRWTDRDIVEAAVGRRSLLADVTTGAVTPAPWAPWDALRTTVAPDGAVIVLRPTTTQVAGRRVEEWRAGRRVASTDATGLGSLTGPAASRRTIAAVRGGDLAQVGAGRVDGVVLLRRRSLEVQAYLPLADRSGWYSDGGALAVLGFVDDRTVLLAVQPSGAPWDPPSATRTLVTWDVVTGSLGRVTSLDADLPLGLASGLLR